MTSELQIGGAMALSYFMIVLNTRAIAVGSVAGVALTEVLVASVGFFVVQRVADASTLGEFVAYVGGGVLGSLAALALSKRRGW
jgi:hypothetical protein